MERQAIDDWRAARDEQPTDRWSGGETGIWLLGLFAMLLGLVLAGYGVWLWRFGRPYFWGSHAAIYGGALIAGLASALRPGAGGPWANRLLGIAPALAGLVMSVFFVFTYHSASAAVPAVNSVGIGLIPGAACGLLLSQKRLGTVPHTAWLWVLHTILSLILLSGSMAAYTFLATLR
jgi:hypothetical protein